MKHNHQHSVYQKNTPSIMVMVMSGIALFFGLLTHSFAGERGYVDTVKVEKGTITMTSTAKFGPDGKTAYTYVLKPTKTTGGMVTWEFDPNASTCFAAGLCFGDGAASGGGTAVASSSGGEGTVASSSGGEGEIAGATQDLGGGIDTTSAPVSMVIPLTAQAAIDRDAQAAIAKQAALPLMIGTLNDRPVYLEDETVSAALLLGNRMYADITVTKQELQNYMQSLTNDVIASGLLGEFLKESNLESWQEYLNKKVNDIASALVVQKKYPNSEPILSRALIEMRSNDGTLVSGNIPLSRSNQQEKWFNDVMLHTLRQTINLKAQDPLFFSKITPRLYGEPVGKPLVEQYLLHMGYGAITAMKTKLASAKNLKQQVANAAVPFLDATVINKMVADQVTAKAISAINAGKNVDVAWNDVTQPESLQEIRRTVESTARTQLWITREKLKRSLPIPLSMSLEETHSKFFSDYMVYMGYN